jgi:glycosyltransferase involved in cell wall biosynthesis
VDVLISPNRFLANRFDEWRQAEGEIKILENVIDINETEISRISVNNKIAINEIDRKIVIAHFGQINPFKGLDILFEAYGILKAGVKDKLDFRVYGENNHWLGGSFDRRLTALFDAAGVNPGDKLVSGIGQVV